MTSIETGQYISMPEYPVLGRGFIDAVMFHPSVRAGLNADYDGDTVSWIPVFSKEANDECFNYFHNASSYVNPDGSPRWGTDDLCDICLFSFTEDPPSEKK